MKHHEWKSVISTMFIVRQTTMALYQTKLIFVNTLDFYSNLMVNKLVLSIVLKFHWGNELRQSCTRLG